MPNLPLQVRKDVRDVFEREDTTAQTSMKKLAETVGYPVTCDIEWQMLWQELEYLHPDKGTFVPTVAGIVEVWCNVLSERLENDRNEPWTEIFLERLAPVQAVKLVVHVSNEPRPKTTWSSEKSAFAVALPSETSFHAANAGSGFQTDFESLFDAQPPVNGSQLGKSAGKMEEWCEVESNVDTRSINTRATGENEVPDTLPSLQTLPRPDVLFRTTTPYLMHVSQNGSSQVTIFGTHEPSLRLLAEYLQRWIKTDPQDVRKIPYLKIKLQESNLGIGLFYDRITIEPFDHHQRNSVINLTLIQAFIEGVLGYHSVPDHCGRGAWEYKRTKPFKA